MATIKLMYVCSVADSELTTSELFLLRHSTEHCVSAIKHGGIGLLKQQSYRSVWITGWLCCV